MAGPADVELHRHRRESSGIDEPMLEGIDQLLRRRSRLVCRLFGCSAHCSQVAEQRLGGASRHEPPATGPAFSEELFEDHRREIGGSEVPLEQPPTEMGQ
jgi:hypothetical protein